MVFAYSITYNVKLRAGPRATHAVTASLEYARGETDGVDVNIIDQRINSVLFCRGLQRRERNYPFYCKVYIIYVVLAINSSADAVFHYKDYYREVVLMSCL